MRKLLDTCPQVCTIVESGFNDERFFIVMEVRRSAKRGRSL